MHQATYPILELPPDHLYHGPTAALDKEILAGGVLALANDHQIIHHFVPHILADSVQSGCLDPAGSKLVTKDADIGWVFRIRRYCLVAVRGEIAFMARNAAAESIQNGLGPTVDVLAESLDDIAIRDCADFGLWAEDRMWSLGSIVLAEGPTANMA